MLEINCILPPKSECLARVVQREEPLLNLVALPIMNVELLPLAAYKHFSIQFLDKKLNSQWYIIQLLRYEHRVRIRTHRHIHDTRA